MSLLFICSKHLGLLNDENLVKEKQIWKIFSLLNETHLFKCHKLHQIFSLMRQNRSSEKVQNVFVNVQHHSSGSMLIYNELLINDCHRNIMFSFWESFNKNKCSLMWFDISVLNHWSNKTLIFSQNFSPLNSYKNTVLRVIARKL